MTDYFELAKNDLMAHSADLDDEKFYDGWIVSAMLDYLKHRRFTFMVNLKSASIGSKSRSKILGQITLIDELIGVMGEFFKK